MRRAALGWCGWAALGAAGCAAPNLLHLGADAAARGETQWSVFTETSSTGTAHYPTLDVMFRVGLGARTELGLRGGGGPIGVDLKGRLLRGGLDLALVPAVHVSPFIVRGPQSVVVASYLPLSRASTSRRASLPRARRALLRAPPRRPGRQLALRGLPARGRRPRLGPASACSSPSVWRSTRGRGDAVVRVAVDRGARRRGEGWLSFGLAVSFVGQPDTSDLP